MKRVRSFSLSSSEEEEDSPPCLEQVRQVFYNRDLLLYRLQTLLDERSFVRLLRCDKRLYVFAPARHYLLRECQTRYGGKHESTAAWIKRCCKLRNPEALQWVLDRTLREYLPLDHSQSRHDDTGIALVAFAKVGYRAAFANNWREGVDMLLRWHKHLQTVENPWMRHTFHYSGTEITPVRVLPKAMVKGAVRGHLTLVRQFLETDAAGLQICDPPYADKKFDRQDLKDAAYAWLFACFSHNDMDNYAFFLDLFNQHYVESYQREPTAEGRYHWADTMCRHLLSEGVNPGALPLLLNMLVYPDEWPISEQMKEAARNSNPVMLRYLVATTRPGRLVGCTEVLQREYHVVEDLLRRVLGTLAFKPTDKRMGKRVRMLQKRMEYLRFVLTNAPFCVDWEEFRPQSRYSSFIHDAAWGLNFNE